jgi:hypothetical protein
MENTNLTNICSVLAKGKKHKELKKLIKQNEHYVVMPAVVAMAAAIKRYHPELLELSEINILILDAVQYEVLDEGQWFRYLPSLLNTRQTVNITFVSDQYEQELSSSCKKILKKDKVNEKHSITTTIIHQNSADAVKSLNVDEFDLAATYKMLFKEDDKSLLNGAYQAVIKSGLPLVAFNASPFLLDIVTTQINAYSQSDTVDMSDNGFGGVETDPGVSYCRYMASIKPSIAKTLEFKNLIAEASIKLNSFQDSVNKGFTRPKHKVLSQKIIQTDNEPKNAIYILDDIYVDIESGQVFTHSDNCSTQWQEIKLDDDLIEDLMSTDSIKQRYSLAASVKMSLINEQVTEEH